MGVCMQGMVRATATPIPALPDVIAADKVVDVPLRKASRDGRGSERDALGSVNSEVGAKGETNGADGLCEELAKAGLTRFQEKIIVEHGFDACTLAALKETDIN